MTRYDNSGQSGYWSSDPETVVIRLTWVRAVWVGFWFTIGAALAAILPVLVATIIIAALLAD